MKTNYTRRQFIAHASALSLAPTMVQIEMANAAKKFHVPAEEEKHQRTFMQWPVNKTVYTSASQLEEAQDAIFTLANLISAFEPVTMLASETHFSRLLHMHTTNVKLLGIPTDDLWCRDSGPLFAIDEYGKLAISHIKFNGWGNRQPHKNDGEIAKKVADYLGLSLIASGLKGEPGGVEHDGHGLLIAHESSWINKNRNPDLSPQAITQKLLKAYGADKMIWSKGVYGQDITDYHIDSLVRFTGPNRAIINLPQKPSPHDPYHQAALQTFEALKANNVDLDVIAEPNNPRVKSKDFVASYVNFYVCNGAVICSQFGDEETDTLARETIQKHYPDREIIMMALDILGHLGGGIHCATQQMPAV